jgi:two-component system phosphate regulon response regulator PhoB
LGGRVKHVLVVEDEPSIRALIAATLTADDCKVESVSDGPSALSRIESWKPDLVLLDVGLPGMSGGEVLRRLRAKEATANTPVVLLTGLEPPEGVLPDAVVLKPFTPSSLRDSLASWLS